MNNPRLAAYRPVFWRDCMIAASIALTVLLVAGVLWWRAPSRLVVSTTTTWHAPVPPNATSVPDGFRLAWSKPDGAAAAPMVVGGTLITADGGSLTGWEIATGKELWHFTEPMPLCAATTAWGKVYAAYRGPKGCSLVVSLDGATGSRPADLHADARSSETDPQIQLTPTLPVDGSSSKDPGPEPVPHLVLAMGATRLELWHEDLLRSVEYGHVGAPFEVKGQPRSHCALHSAVVGDETFAVLERCRRDDALRLSFLKSSPKKDNIVEQESTAVLSALSPPDGAELLAIKGNRVVMYVPPSGAQAAKLVVVDGHGAAQASYELSLPVTARRSLPWRTSPALVTWWTGSGVVGISGNDLSVLFQTPDLAGPATAMADQLVAPTASGIAVLDPGTGAKLREIQAAPDGPDSRNGARLAVCGSVVLRQQGGTVQVYSPASGQDPHPL